MKKTQQDILTEISTLRRTIEENYPELQKYLDETRETLPQGGIGGEIDVDSLKNHRDSLKSLIDKYKKQEK
ncbi:hypothetical protein N7U66_12475 [Lacinutrix neustonica]|uniref:Uncharacterized protein n=1 Tax=Lacinutrix neustonica TaxID=2980107 RepID=A0A9E8MU47_9FLAO|nr:hypothetical protein [Lacinutrix neustonica]WAC00999.1 hypothetical protein N7U66_12475 [Lacinutrix neustonica]